MILKSQNGVYNQILPKPKTTNASVEVTFSESNFKSCQSIYTTDLANRDLSESVTIPSMGLQLTQGCADLAINVQATEVSCNEKGFYLDTFK